MFYFARYRKNKRSNELRDFFLKRYSYIDINNNIKNKI